MVGRDAVAARILCQVHRGCFSLVEHTTLTCFVVYFAQMKHCQPLLIFLASPNMTPHTPGCPATHFEEKSLNKEIIAFNQKKNKKLIITLDSVDETSAGSACVGQDSQVGTVVILLRSEV